MPKPLSMRFIRSQIRARHYRLTKHATIARLERGIMISDIERTLRKTHCGNEITRLER